MYSTFANERSKLADSHTCLQAAKVAAHKIVEKRTAAERTTDIYPLPARPALMINGVPHDAQTGTPLIAGGQGRSDAETRGKVEFFTGFLLRIAVYAIVTAACCVAYQICHR